MSMWRHVDPASSGCPNIVGQVDMPDAGHELHPFGRNACLDMRRKLDRETAYFREEETRAIGEIIGRSYPMRHLSEQIVLVAPTNATVLILGESGTGKELVAKEIHKASSRCDGPMVRVNCAAVPHDLFENEFFGHVKGAFTGFSTSGAHRG
jgi:transcriptional regulator with GAF, ATPase, and Fis domain